MSSSARMIVGIDLGTTNSVVAYVDAGAHSGAAPGGPRARAPIRIFEVPQVVEPGHVAARPLLPSYLYLAGEHDLPAGSLDLPWARRRDHAVGELAQKRGAEVPGRVVASAKSWLRHRAVDRTAAILPWNAPDDVPRVSPVTTETRILEHVRDAWNEVIAVGDSGLRLEAQEVYLCVPASFDPAARELTARAAAAAGIDHVTLLEEPQAAFYAWLDRLGDRWREEVQVGDRVLVCDVGGGTTDFTLIAVGEAAGELTLERVAVGNHLLLGGDNMDLTLAHAVAAKLGRDGHRIDAWQMQSLWHLARAAKERLLSDEGLDSEPLVLLGRGSKLIGGSIRSELRRDEVEQLLVDGFFPRVAPEARPAPAPESGLRELGLPYESDPAVTRHMAQFLARAAAARGSSGGGTATADGGSTAWPTALLLNGGVMKSPALSRRLAEVLAGWAGRPVTMLAGAGEDLDLAVARGAAYYGLARRGEGVRIRGGTARAYYVGIESAMPAVPGVPAPLKAVCVAPFGMEEGSEAELPGRELALVVGEKAVFRFLAAADRADDRIGDVVESWEIDTLEELEPVVATLAPDAGSEDDAGTSGRGAPTVPVRLHARVTELGILELWCVSRDGQRRWKLEFDVRERPPLAREEMAR